MVSIFLSYSRQNKQLVEKLVGDIRFLGHRVWFDQELSGGHIWWERILEQIRSCDTFIFAMDPNSLASIPCQRELDYASKLKKPILPILISDNVSINLLPKTLSQIQYVDYRNQSSDAAFRLARSLNDLPTGVGLPNPLPKSPEAPTSYLATLAERVDAKADMSREAQIALITDLKRNIKGFDSDADAINLLLRLRNRHDLLAENAKDIDEILKKKHSGKLGWPFSFLDVVQKMYTSAIQISKDASAAAITKSDRLKCVTAGTVTGLLFGLMFSRFVGFPDYWEFGVAIVAAGGAVSGAVVGLRRGPLIAAAFGAIITTLLWSMLDSDVKFSQIRAGFFGAPLGAFLGSVVSVVILRPRPRSLH